MDTVVLKFGGAAFASIELFDRVADIIFQKIILNQNIVVVVSAMGGVTDQLIALAHQVNKKPPQREYDMLVSVGERVSGSLLAMALEKRGVDAISLTGSQAGIITCSKHKSAEIIDVRPQRVLRHLEERKIVIIAGFQGVSEEEKNVTTLGRGGSDTTAVALAAALKSSSVEFFKDVPGIFLADPKKNPSASLIKSLSYSRALTIVNSGAEVLHSRSVLLAERNNIPLYIRSFISDSKSPGTVIKSQDSSERPSQPLFER